MLDNGNGSSSGSGGGLRSSPLRTSPSAVSVASSCNSGDRKRPFLIGVAGGTASGKARLTGIEEKEFYAYLQSFVSFLQSTVCDKIMKEVQKQSGGTAERQIISLSQDSFYRELSREEIAQAESGTFNFDHPGGKCLIEFPASR